MRFRVLFLGLLGAGALNGVVDLRCHLLILYPQLLFGYLAQTGCFKVARDASSLRQYIQYRWEMGERRYSFIHRL